MANEYEKFECDVIRYYTGPRQIVCDTRWVHCLIIIKVYLRGVSPSTLLILGLIPHPPTPPPPPQELLIGMGPLDFQLSPPPPPPLNFGIVFSKIHMYTQDQISPVNHWLQKLQLIVIHDCKMIHTYRPAINLDSNSVYRIEVQVNDGTGNGFEDIEVCSWCRFTVRKTNLNTSQNHIKL